MTPEEKYRDLYEQMYDLCEEQGWGDPFSYARSREIYMAGLLGHKVADDYSGEDAIDEDENEWLNLLKDKIDNIMQTKAKYDMECG